MIPSPSPSSPTEDGDCPNLKGFPSKPSDPNMLTPGTPNELLRRVLSDFEAHCFGGGEIEAGVQSVVGQNMKPIFPFGDDNDLQEHKQLPITISRRGDTPGVLGNRPFWEEESGNEKSDLVGSPRATESSKTTSRSTVDFSNLANEPYPKPRMGESVGSVGVRLTIDTRGTGSGPEDFVSYNTEDFNEENRPASLTPLNDQSSTATEDYIDDMGSQIINSVVFTVTQWLRSVFATAHQTTRGTEEASQSKSSQPAQSEQKHTSKGLGPSRKRKLDDRGNGSGYDDDNDGQDSLGNIIPNSKGKERQLPKFACPYFKYNPARYKEWRICPGPGWPDIHRVKEHLYRRHRQPSHRCGRCWQPFENEEDYISHQRATEPCSLRDKEPVEGFDASQENQLRSRKKTTNCLSEVVKWEVVFSILFPHVPKEDIPSPFYDYEQYGNMAPNSRDSLLECEEYILREVPLRLRQSLRSEFNRDLQIVEESLKKKAIDNTRILLAEVFREFRQAQQQGKKSEASSEVAKLVDNADSGSTQVLSTTLQEYEQSRLELTHFNDSNLGLESLGPPTADNVNTSSTQAFPTISQDSEQNFPGPTEFYDFDFGLEPFDSSALANLEAILSEGVTMEEIIQQPSGETGNIRSDSGYESYQLEDRQESSGGLDWSRDERASGS